MYVKKLHLENVKAFPEVRFNLERPDGTYAGWTAFVGGNSSGKSTILRAIALALMGPEAGNRLMGPPAGWILKGQSKASSMVTLSWDQQQDEFKKRGKLPEDSFEAGVRWFFENKGDEVPQFRAAEKRNPAGGRIMTAERGPLVSQLGRMVCSRLWSNAAPNGELF